MLRCDFIYDSDDFPPSYLSELVGTQALLAFVDVAKLSTFSLIISSCLCQEISQLPIGCRNKGKGKGKCKGKGSGKEQGKTEERSNLDDVAKQQSQPWKSSRMKERLRESFMLEACQRRWWTAEIPPKFAHAPGVVVLEHDIGQVWNLYFSDLIIIDL